MVSLAAIVLLALAVRFIGIDYALPTISYTESSILDRVWNMAASGDMNPHWFQIPSLHFYIDLAILKMLSLTGEVSREAFALACRSFEAVVGALTVLVVFLIGANIYHKKAGLVAAFLLAIFPAHIFYSHIARPDILVTFFTLMVLLLSIYLLRTMALKDYIVVGLVAGLAVSTRYNGAFCLLMPVAAHFIYVNTYHEAPANARFRNLFIMLGVALAAFIATTPFSIFDFPTFWADLVQQAQGAQIGIIAAISRYSGEIMRDLGLLMPLLLLGGLGYAIKRHNRYDILNIIFCIVLIIFLLNWKSPAIRFALPLIAVLMVMSAGMLIAASRRLMASENRARRQMGAILLPLILIVALLAPGQVILGQNSTLCHPSISQIAWEWTGDNIPPGSRLFRASNTPCIQYLMDEEQPRYDVDSGQGPTWEYEDYQAFDEANYQYVILTSAHRKFINSPDVYPAQYNFYHDFYANYELVREFKSEGGQYGASTIEYTKVGNKIYIFKRR